MDHCLELAIGTVSLSSKRAKREKSAQAIERYWKNAEQGILAYATIIAIRNGWAARWIARRPQAVSALC
jgi:hypothetical protein